MNRFIENKTKLKIHDFNNLQKILSINIYDIVYVNNKKEASDYIKWIKRNYSSIEIYNKLSKLVSSINAKVLDKSLQDFIPYGSSSLILLEEQFTNLHLDKSHISSHTYFDITENFVIFRIDIDISTCGLINPLNILNKIFDLFYCDIVDIDFLIRGFHRLNNEMIFNDYAFESISDFIKVKENYSIQNINNPNNRTWRLKMKKNITNLEINEYIHPNYKKFDNDLIINKINDELNKIYLYN